MAESKKYFWLKLKRDFFKRHDIQIIESMPNGKDYILFYLKLLCESVDHEGNLRFSEQIPYNDQMLSTITNTNVDIVRSAIKVFSELGMMDVLDDGTYYMHEVQKLLGFETEWARKQREYRAKRQQEDNVLSLSDKSKSKSKSIEIDIDKDIEIDKELEKDKEITAPKEQKHVHGEYAHVRLKDSEREKLIEEYGQEMTDACIKYLDEYIEMKGYKAKNHYLCIKKWVLSAVKEKGQRGNRNTNKVASQLEQSYEMMAGWAEEE